MLPPFYQPDSITPDYQPDFGRAYDAGLAAFQQPAAEDKRRVLLLLIDAQNDFVFPAPHGRLPVPGAPADTRRTIEWLYRNTPHITQIAASLDTHYPLQIFYPSWWRDAAGQHPTPYTVISAAEVKAKRWLPLLEPEWSMQYVERLETDGKKQLMIWPFHCMEGSTGRAIVPALSEAISYHSGARASQPIYITKGTLADTEFYSAFEPEVKDPANSAARLNTAFLDTLTAFDLIYVAGQARSHCVLESIRSIARYFADRPEIIARLRILNDCTSSIAGFEAATEAAYAEFAENGVRFVNSVDSVG